MSSQKQGTNSRNSPWYMTDDSIVLHYCNSEGIMAITCLSSVLALFIDIEVNQGDSVANKT